MGVPPGDSFGGAPALKPHPFLSEKKITCRKQHSTCINLWPVLCARGKEKRRLWSVQIPGSLPSLFLHLSSLSSPQLASSFLRFPLGLAFFAKQSRNTEEFSQWLHTQVPCRESSPPVLPLPLRRDVERRWHRKKVARRASPAFRVSSAYG